MQESCLLVLDTLQLYKSVDWWSRRWGREPVGARSLASQRKLAESLKLSQDIGGVIAVI
jgi:hypothetical protein